MAKSTPATVALTKAGVAFTLHQYAYDPTADRIGLQAAMALGADPSRVLKTLMALVDQKPVCVVIPSDKEISMKSLAAIFSGKSARMMPAAEAERITGYRIGGISPFGQKRTSPTVFHATAISLPAVFVNGGQRGLQIEAAPGDLAKALSARIETVAA